MWLRQSGRAAQTTAKAEETTQKEASAETTAADAKADSSADIDYPTKDITIIVPFDAGGGNDILARLSPRLLWKENISRALTSS
ncbi:MAG: hypothetical protein V8R61_10915 [Enterocloster sp.]